VLYIPPPLPPLICPELPLKVTFVNVGLLESLYIPPPDCAELSLKVTFVNVGLLPEVLYIPLPLPHAKLPLKVTFVNAGLLESLYIPLPDVAELRLKVTFVNSDDQARCCGIPSRRRAPSCR
jgi:hypothetical protein